MDCLCCVLDSPSMHNFLILVFFMLPLKSFPKYFHGIRIESYKEGNFLFKLRFVVIKNELRIAEWKKYYLSITLMFLETAFLLMSGYRATWMSGYRATGMRGSRAIEKQQKKQPKETQARRVGLKKCYLGIILSLGTMFVVKRMTDKHLVLVGY